MKLTSSKFILLCAIWVTTTLLGTTSCNKNQSTESKDPKEVAEDHNDAKFDNNGQEKVAQLLVNAQEFNLETVSLGELAVERGTTNHVRELGKTMQDHYRTSINDVAALAKSKTVTIPTSLSDNGQETVKSLSNKTGIEFDKAYADQTVKSLKDEVSQMENASIKSTDSNIREWASNALPTLRMQLDQALTCQAECAKM